MTAGHFGGLGLKDDYAKVLEELSEICCDVVDQHVADQVLSPLARTILLQ